MYIYIYADKRNNKSQRYSGHYWSLAFIAMNRHRVSSEQLANCKGDNTPYDLFKYV